MVTLGAPGAGGDQIENLAILLRGKLQNFPGLLLPAALHHYRQTVNHHVKKAADQQAHKDTEPNQKGWACGKKF